MSYPGEYSPKVCGKTINVLIIKPDIKAIVLFVNVFKLVKPSMAKRKKKNNIAKPYIGHKLFVNPNDSKEKNKPIDPAKKNPNIKDVIAKLFFKVITSLFINDIYKTFGQKFTTINLFTPQSFYTSLPIPHYEIRGIYTRRNVP
tara:strand:+ start:293 stop:724 length:432 start_codon:yes stop_codon:yes gene_type:complete